MLCWPCFLTVFFMQRCSKDLEERKHFKKNKPKPNQSLLFSFYSECMKETFPLSRCLLLLGYAPFAYAAYLQRAANMKGFADFQICETSFLLLPPQLLYFSGKLVSNHSSFSSLRCFSQYCTFVCTAGKPGCQQIELSVFSCPGLLNPSIKFLLQSSRLMVSLDILE